MSALDHYSVRLSPPAVDIYLSLREAGGLSPFSREAAERGLNGAVIALTLLHDNVPIGMGRVIGDGGCFFQIVDIVVRPEHQGKGLGKIIMQTLLDELRAIAPKSAYVSLIADVPANHLYEQFGFRETAPRSLGMSLIL